MKEPPTPGSKAATKSVLITDLGELAPHEADWRALAVARGNPHVTPEFFRAWVESHSDHAHPFVPAIFALDGRLRGLLPLVITHDATRHVQLAGGDFWMPFSPIALPQDEEELGIAGGRLLASHRSDWRTLSLDNVEPGAPWLDALTGALTSAYGRKLFTKHAEHPWLVVEAPDGWDAYLARRSRKFRHEMRRIERRLRESHVVSFHDTTTTAELRANLETLFSFHMERRSELGGSTYDEPAMRETIERFAAGELEHGCLRLRVAQVDGKDSAATLAFRAGERCAVYIVSWDPRLASSSLGRIVMADSIASAVVAGVREIELSVGHSRYKAEFATTERVACTTWFYPPRTAFLLRLRKTARLLLPTPVRRVLGRRLRAGAGRVDLPI